MLISNIRIRIQNTKLEVSSGFVSQFLDRVIAGLIAFYGGYQVIKGRMTLGSLTAIMVYLNQLMGLQNKFAYFFQTTVLGLVSCRRLAEVLDEKATVLESKEAKEAEPLCDSGEREQSGGEVGSGDNIGRARVKLVAYHFILIANHKVLLAVAV